MLLHPEVFPVSVKVPFACPEPMIPCMTKVLLTEPPFGLPVMFSVIKLLVPPVPICEAICPVIAVPDAKHEDSAGA